MPTVDHEKSFSAKLMRSSAGPVRTNCSVRLTTSSHSLAIAATRSWTPVSPSRKRAFSCDPLGHILSRSTAPRRRLPPAGLIVQIRSDAICVP